ncbi:hypothetical protein LINPERPRIM_LOCUS774 [Linum perenne]
MLTVPLEIGEARSGESSKAVAVPADRLKQPVRSWYAMVSDPILSSLIFQSWLESEATARDYKGIKKVWHQTRRQPNNLKRVQAVAGDLVLSPVQRFANKVVAAQVTPLADNEVNEGLEHAVVQVNGQVTNNKTLKRRLIRKKKKSAQKALLESLNAV